MRLSLSGHLVLRAAVVALSLGVAACAGDDPTPEKIDPSEPIVKRPRRPERNENSPFQHADRDPPKARDGEQLGDAELEAALATAKSELAEDRRSAAMTTLRNCANKKPASGRCDGELALMLAPIERRKAEAKYYLLEASQIDDPKADAELYRRVGEQLRKIGEPSAAVASLELALKREDTAQGHVALSRVLQSMPDQLPRAADELAKAAEMDPDDMELLYERGTILGQIREADAARLGAKILQTYVDAGKFPDEYRAEATKARITELEGVAKTYAAEAKAGGKPNKG